MPGQKPCYHPLEAGFSSPLLLTTKLSNTTSRPHNHIYASSTSLLLATQIHINPKCNAPNPPSQRARLQPLQLSARALASLETEGFLPSLASSSLEDIHAINLSKVRDLLELSPLHRCQGRDGFGFVGFAKGKVESQEEAELKGGIAIKALIDLTSSGPDFGTAEVAGEACQIYPPSERINNWDKYLALERQVQTFHNAPMHQPVSQISNLQVPKPLLSSPSSLASLMLHSLRFRRTHHLSLRLFLDISLLLLWCECGVSGPLGVRPVGRLGVGPASMTTCSWRWGEGEIPILRATADAWAWTLLLLFQPPWREFARMVARPVSECRLESFHIGDWGTARVGTRVAAFILCNRRRGRDILRAGSLGRSMIHSKSRNKSCKRLRLMGYGFALRMLDFPSSNFMFLRQDKSTVSAKLGPRVRKVNTKSLCRRIASQTMYWLSRPQGGHKLGHLEEGEFASHVLHDSVGDMALTRLVLKLLAVVRKSSDEVDEEVLSMAYSANTLFRMIASSLYQSTDCTSDRDFAYAPGHQLVPEKRKS
ncbi:uncharacterized protein BDR25DRAFT_358396 [Lindgomyces ingoldianus]|uniref:Uncharacterized protein n=1 Tax=Lindgomyces ingoldianus TaxID=673940 RepID=A0ACB6QMF5_9PLEO|nr:uncharacterized protein BDR25DRAFT_358396 [Lindgomyces ingoldianus]KAF2467710.1 hypothetical protein BDR25DRAFT_358396 [Lindgomyces ingoldianus]